MEFLRLRLRSVASIWMMLSAVCILSLGAGLALAADYPPPVSPPTGTPQPLKPTEVQGLIFTNTHTYAFGLNPAALVIKVEVFDNWLGDFTKYHWVYTVTNNGFDPNPGSSNGFSGFETALPAAVPDLGNVTAPDGIPPWIINFYSGAPIEWDLPNTQGAPVGGGTLPGETEVYSFTSAPRLITLSTGWFHTWESNVQTFIVSYPSNDGPEVPDVLAPPNQELCCYLEGEIYVCQPLPAGQCTANGGTIVVNCQSCPTPTPTRKSSWGDVKRIYR